MTEEFCCSMDSSSGGSDVLSQDSRVKRNVSHKKKVSIGDTIEYMNDREKPAYFPTRVCSCKPDREARVLRKAKHHPQRLLGFVHKRQDPSNAQRASNMSADDVLPFATVPRQKTRQKSGQENKAATIIQSAWRGSQARQNMERMNKAATKIQATFRGHLTRTELPLGLCCCGWTGEQKKTRARNQSRIFPTFPSCLPQSGLDSERPAESQRIYLPSHKPRHHHKKVMDSYSPLNRKGPFVMASALRPGRTGFPCASSNVFATGMEKQRYQDAAATIQEAWRAYQIRQKRRPFIRVNGYPFPSNITIKHATWKNAMLGSTVEEQEIQQFFGNSDILLLRKSPRIRNINIHTVVKSLPVSSPTPNISIEVKSPHAVVQGFQRDLSRGVQAVYTVRNASASGASQILLHVNTQKENHVL